mgnify:FL=1|tara:strand:+ start:1400 stop:2029 length:630 start_codon:yes stop_codon:yes gene_type:complete
MKILNLYACLGGNRYKWGDDHEITAVEWDTELARMYQERFPNDKVVVGDAHKYLLDHYTEYDFIWSSPPCPTHSRVRFANTKAERVYPEMSLYQEIIFLDTHFKGKYVVENVIPYYKPLIEAQKRGRHLYWANFNLPQNLSNRKAKVGSGTNEVSKLCDFHDIDLSTYKGKQRKDKVARNLVDYEAGKTILDTAMNVMYQESLEQAKLF